MSTADEGFAWRGAAGPRPVLAASVAALEAMTSSSPERLWALGEGEVTAALQLLGRLSACVDAHLVSVLAEAKRRSLDQGEGWGPVDWARAVAPELPQRTVLAADAVAGSADEPRLAEVVAAATVACTGETTAGLPVAKAAALVRFHRSVRCLADPEQLESLTGLLLDSVRGHGGLSEGDLAVALRHTANELRPDRLVEHEDDVRRPTGRWSRAGARSASPARRCCSTTRAPRSSTPLSTRSPDPPATRRPASSTCAPPPPVGRMPFSTSSAARSRHRTGSRGRPRRPWS